MTLGPSYSEPWQTVQDYLAAGLAAALQPGGSLDFLVAIEAVAPPMSEAQPILGWQWLGVTDNYTGQNRLTQAGNFEFNLIVERNFDPTVTDAPRQIKETAEKYWNDRAGRGLGAFLRSDPQLGGTVTTSYVSSHSVSVGRGILEEDIVSAVIVATLTFTYEDFPIFL